MANIYSVPENFSTTLNVPGNIDASQTTGIILTSVTGLPTDGGILCLDWATTLDLSVAEYIEYTGISGSTLTGVLRAAEGSTGRTHNNGATVVGVISQAHIKRLKERLDGTDTTGIAPGKLIDTSGNTQLGLTKTATAVNYVNVTNAATGGGPTIGATGGDTNVDLLLTTKGTGVVKINGTTVSTTGSTDGWTASADTFVYVSASSFKVAAADRTAVFTKGTRVKFANNSTTYYGTVISSSFSTDTTITLAVNADYTINNSAITLPFYSYQLSPAGYPYFFNFTPVWTTYAVAPTGGQVRFAIQSTLVIFEVYPTTAGTSNSGSTMTLALPITSSANAGSWTAAFHALDNSAGLGNPVLAQIVGTSQTTMNIYRDWSGSGWTASGSKVARGTIMYEY